MTLTIPRAGITFGRSADTRSQLPDVGGEIARFGEATRQIGTALEGERQQRAYRRAELQMLERFNGLEQELSQIGDPDALDSTFRDRAPSVLGGPRPAQVPLLDGLAPDDLSPEFRERLDMRYEELRLGTGRSVGRNSIALRQSARVALTSHARDVTLAGAVEASTPEGVDVNADQFATMVNELVQAGIWDPERGARELTGWARDQSEARAIRGLSQDPQGLLDALDGQAFAPLTVERRESLRAQATARLQSADREANAALRLRLREGISVVRAGYDYADAEALENDPAVAAHPDGAEFLAAVALHRARPDLARLPPREQQRILAEETARPVAGGEGFQTDQRAALRAAVTASTEAWSRDPLGHAAELGMIEAQQLPDPANDADNTLAGTVRARLAQAQALTEGGYTERPVLLRPEERPAFAAATAVTAAPDARARLASDLVRALGDDAPRLIGQFSDDPVFGFVGGMVAVTGNSPLAQQIFEGQRAAASSDVPLPSLSARRSLWFENVEGENGVLAAYGDAALREQVIGATDALVTYRLRGADPANREPDAFRDTWLQARHEVMGGTGQHDARDARGGVQPLNGVPTLLPMGISGREVSSQLATLASGLDQQWTPTGATIAPEALNALRAVSVGGRLPSLGGEPLDGYTLRSLVFEAARDGVYNAYLDGMPLQVVDEAGNPWQLDMRALVEWQPGVEPQLTVPYELDMDRLMGGQP